MLIAVVKNSWSKEIKFFRAAGAFPAPWGPGAQCRERVEGEKKRRVGISSEEGPGGGGRGTDRERFRFFPRGCEAARAAGGKLAPLPRRAASPVSLRLPPSSLPLSLLPLLLLHHLPASYAHSAARRCWRLSPARPRSPLSPAAGMLPGTATGR